MFFLFIHKLIYLISTRRQHTNTSTDTETGKYAAIHRRIYKHTCTGYQNVDHPVSASEIILKKNRSIYVEIMTYV